MKRSLQLTGACALITACAAGSDGRTDAVRVDTLPGGIVRTMSERPMDAGRLQLTLLHTIQPAEGSPGELIAPGDVVLTPDGGVAVVETKPAQVRIFGADGTWLRTIGREGQGPGEFLSGSLGITGDTLVVQDARAARAILLDWRTGQPLGQVRTACCYFFAVTVDDSGRVAVRTMAPPRDSTPLVSQGYVRVALASAAADTVWVTERHPHARGAFWHIRDGENMRATVPVPLQPTALYAVDRNGDFVTGWTGEYTLRVTRTGRDTLALFGRTYAPQPVSAAEKTAIVEANIAAAVARELRYIDPATVRAAFDPSLLPDQRPAFEWLSVDAAGRRWVRLSSPDTTVITFDVFGRDGRWLDVVRIGAADWSRNPWHPVAWGRDRVAIALEDAEGRPLIKVYRIGE